MKDKYYTGTIKISFYQVNAEDDDEMYKKIESQLPAWMEVDMINFSDIETQSEVLKNYDEN